MANDVYFSALSLLLDVLSASIPYLIFKQRRSKDERMVMLASGGGRVKPYEAVRRLTGWVIRIFLVIHLSIS